MSEPALAPEYAKQTFSRQNTVQLNKTNRNPPTKPDLFKPIQNLEFKIHNDCVFKQIMIKCKHIESLVIKHCYRLHIIVVQSLPFVNFSNYIP
ncbi:hypothetical protein DNL43_03970 [Lentilactobacillus kefiri]|nr:hypothetical protein DNL43_03970 [Lentilactobacillus kefiri]